MDSQMKAILKKIYLISILLLVLLFVAGVIAKWFFGFDIETEELLLLGTPIIPYLIYQAKQAYKKLR
jgi:hypothetical protein